MRKPKMIKMSGGVTTVLFSLPEISENNSNPLAITATVTNNIVSSSINHCFVNSRSMLSLQGHISSEIDMQFIPLSAHFAVGYKSKGRRNSKVLTNILLSSETDY